MVDFTNTCESVMTVDAVKRLFARTNGIYRHIIEQLVDVEDPEVADFLEEYMPNLTDFLMDVALSETTSDVVDEECKNLNVDMDELLDVCEFFNFNPYDYFIFPEED